MSSNEAKPSDRKDAGFRNAAVAQCAQSARALGNPKTPVSLANCPQFATRALQVRREFLAVACCAMLALSSVAWGAEEMEWVRISNDKKGFVFGDTGKPFVPWGFNYDHDEKGRLIEDYWNDEWPKVEADFAEMKELGANVVRIHLQVARFLDAADKPNQTSLDQLAKLVELAEKQRLYLDLTGLGCYHKQDVPEWYDALGEQGRWNAQATFWEAVAGKVAKSPAIFCYDLMNEPVVPGGKRKDGDWLGPAFAGKHFVQVITLDQAGRPRPEIARQWIEHLVAAIRKVDERHLITVGLVPWSLERPGLTSGFVPSKVTDKLDFVCIHLYPEAGKLDEAMSTLEGFAIGKPVVIEELFPLKSSPKEMDEFVERSKKHASGWISFYWGKTPQELEGSDKFVDAILLEWLKLFQKRAKATSATAPAPPR